MTRFLPNFSLKIALIQKPEWETALVFRYPRSPCSYRIPPLLPRPPSYSCDSPRLALQSPFKVRRQGGSIWLYPRGCQHVSLQKPCWIWKWKGRKAKIQVWPWGLCGRGRNGWSWKIPEDNDSSPTNVIPRACTLMLTTLTSERYIILYLCCSMRLVSGRAFSDLLSFWLFSWKAVFTSSYSGKSQFI